jgi:predicted PolB exonuclease-like 3'-5' exonuclease
MDVLAAYQSRAYASLDSIATLVGLPGKMGMNGSHVFDYYQQGKLKEIRDYCETDVLNTYLVYLRFELVRGHLTATAYEALQEQVKELLKSSEQPHLLEYLTTWQTTQQPT